jgi:hypothetical protein
LPFQTKLAIWQPFYAVNQCQAAFCKGSYMKIRRFTRFLFLSFLLWTGISHCSAKTRWSSLHLIPDADLLTDNDFVLDFDTYYFSDSTQGSVIKPGGTLTYSIMNWVNFEAGYAGGATLGLKARVLGEESKNWLPSMALGIRSCISNKEMYFYDRSDDKYSNELYLAFAKSVEPIRLRFHLGILSIPNVKSERFNPYLGLEKYLGGGVYTTFEMHRRDHVFIPSLFTSWRFWKSRFELSAGVVSFVDMLLDNNNDINAGITSTQNDAMVRPGVYFGLRFNGNIGKFGGNGGLASLEDRVNEQRILIDSLRSQFDSLKIVFEGGSKKLNSIDSSLTALADSSLKSKERYRIIAIEKLNSLRVFYSQEPFEPELVKKGYGEIVGYRNEMVPTLFEIVFDLGLDKKIRSLAVSVLGQIGTSKALDALIDILSQSKETEIKIEALISLGNNKETRAVYLMKQLANDPDDALSFTASEVLKKIESLAGMNADVNDTSNRLPVTIPESKIGEKKNPSVNDKTAIPQSQKNVTPADIPVKNIPGEKNAVEGSNQLDSATSVKSTNISTIKQANVSNSNVSPSVDKKSK